MTASMVAALTGGIVAILFGFVRLLMDVWRDRSQPFNPSKPDVIVFMEVQQPGGGIGRYRINPEDPDSIQEFLRAAEDAGAERPRKVIAQHHPV